MKSYSESYKAAGVDVTAGYRAVELMKEHVKSTEIPGVLGELGGFGGLFAPDLRGMSEPVLVSGTDGVGTKLRIAFLMDKHDTVGIDCVAMCANDVACVGARPLFFLDYLALGKNVPEKTAAVVAGVAEGCRRAGCALIGGETAEMPGFYPPDEYDIAGFCVGVVDRPALIDGSRIRPGDAVLGLASSGVHSNGFSLIRKVLNVKTETLSRYVDDLGKTLGEELLTPTEIYVKSLLELVRRFDVRGICHITGGGFYENVPRMLNEHTDAEISLASFPVPPVFDLIRNCGKIDEHDMYNTFNMGIGMMVAVPAEQADEALRFLKDAGEKAYLIGEIVPGAKEVRLKK